MMMIVFDPNAGVEEIGIFNEGIIMRFHGKLSRSKMLKIKLDWIPRSTQTQTAKQFKIP
jgi:hypothetical protein